MCGIVPSNYTGQSSLIAASPSSSSDGTNSEIQKSTFSTAVQAFLAGSTSGTISCILFQPLDLVKTRIQTAHVGKFDETILKPVQRPTSIVSTIYSVVQKENALGLWKGLSPSLYRTVPGVGMYFCTLHFMKSFWNVEPTFYENLALGFTARGLVGAALLPVTVIKARFESGKFHYKTVPHALKIIWKLEGVKGLFSGFTATIARDAPFSGLYLMFYSHGKKIMQSVTAEETGPKTHFTCGIFAGILASLVTHPADVAKTQLQLYPSRYHSTRHCVATILNEHGILGFFRGVLPRCLRRTLISALSWTVFEEIMKTMKLKV